MPHIQEEQLSQFLAKRVLGGEVRPKFESLADCEPLLDKIETDGLKWHFDNTTDGGYGCQVWGQRPIGVVWKQTRTGHGWSKDSRTEALCLAIARCYGWMEEA